MSQAAYRASNLPDDIVIYSRILAVRWQAGIRAQLWLANAMDGGTDGKQSFTEQISVFEARVLTAGDTVITSRPAHLLCSSWDADTARQQHTTRRAPAPSGRPPS